MKKLNLIIIPFLLLAFNASSKNYTSTKSPANAQAYPNAKPDSYWKKVLFPEAYEILVNRGTETPYKNPYWNNHQKGVYVSAATGKPLFSSDTKFDSGTGWPSFFKPIDPKKLKL